MIILTMGTTLAMPRSYGASPEHGSDELHYDPSTCKTDAHDKLYIALGRNVLAVSQMGTVVVGQIYPGTGDNRLVPPDPTDRQGCPDNPEQVESYAFAYQLDATLQTKAGIPLEKRPRPDLLQLFRTLKGDAVPSAHDALWMGEDLQLGVARSTCEEQATLKERLPNGMMACRIGPKARSATSPRVEDWAASYVAPSDVYKTPLGEKFVVNCNGGLYTRGIGDCKVAYVMRPGLGVSYRFQPYLTPQAIPIENIIEFDRGLRAEIESSLVKNYRWPDEAAADQVPKSEEQK